MLMFQLHGGRPTISNFAMKTKTIIRNISINGADTDYDMKYKNLSVV